MIESAEAEKMRGFMPAGFILALLLSGILPSPVPAETLEHGPPSRARFEEGMAQWKAGNLEAALASFEATADRHYAAASWSGYEFLFERKGQKRRDVREDFRKVLLGPPDEAEAHVFVGNLFVSGSHWMEATREYQEAIRLKPGHAQAHLLLGHEWARQRRWEAAVEPLRTAVSLAPEDPAARMLLAIVLGYIGTTSAREEAIREAQEAVRLVPDSPQAHWTLGDAYLDLARRDEAAAEFRTYLSLVEPDSAGTGRAKELLFQMGPFLSP